MITQLRRRSQVTLPSEVIKKMKLQEGDNLDIELEDDRIVIRPVIVINRDQSWFWTKEWQTMEKEADKDIEQGKIHKAKNVKALIKKLES